MKKILSVLLSLTFIINIFALFGASTIKVQAADYAATLRSKGFPESYLDDLVELHKKYPNWIFEPLKTNLDFHAAVNGERKNHSNQLIEKSSGTSTSMYCDCAQCKKNGQYVIQEASNWVSASEKAVEYYLDPRNFLNEKEIFQFESTKYNGTQTQSGVESILNGTWMHNSKISYKDTTGASRTLTITYSDSIMAAASRNGMSSYYLASKIRQEVGGAKPTAGGASGTNKTYPGIFNYYNIGAYTGALDGLKWASTSNATAAGTGYYTNCQCRVREKATTSSKEIVMLPANTKVTYKSTTAKQSDGYTWYQISVTYNNKSYTGYIRTDLVDKKTTTAKPDTYNRPWTSPHISIVNGAKYIAQNYKTQFTGYLQKFNVNPESGTLHTHEYMANVAAAASEARTTYTAYSNAGILGITKTFSIPVFNNMPNDSNTSTTTKPSSSTTTTTTTTAVTTLPCVTGLKATGSDTKQINLTWNKVSGATGYRVDIMKNGKYVKYATTKSNKISVTGLNSFQEYTFRVKAYQTKSNNTIWGKYWVGVTYGTRAPRISGFKATGSNNSAVYLAWNKNARATGYRIYKYDPKTKKDTLYKDIKGANNTTLKVSGLKNNTKYYFKIQAYYTVNGRTYLSYRTNAITTATKYNMVTLNSAKSNSKKKITVKWNKAIYDGSGYQVMWSTTKNFSSNYLTVNVNGRNSLSTTLNTAQSGKRYYVRVRAYKTVNGKKTYCSWSGVKSVVVR